MESLRNMALKRSTLPRSCVVGAEAVLVNKVGRKICLKCAHTVARMQGPTKESKKVGT